MTAAKVAGPPDLGSPVADSQFASPGRSRKDQHAEMARERAARNPQKIAVLGSVMNKALNKATETELFIRTVLK